MKLAVVTETFPPEINGVATSIARMLEALERRGHCVLITRPRQAGDCAGSGDLESRTTITVRGFPLPGYPGLRFGLPAASTLREVWSRDRPDLVHVVTEGPLGWSAVSAARRLGLPVTSDFRTHFDHYSGHYGYGWIRHGVSRYLRRFHARTDLTFVPTERLSSDLAQQGYSNLRVVGRGIDARLFHPGRRSSDLRGRWGLGPDDLAIIYVGRIAPEKNLDLVLRAFEAIRRERHEARLVFVGDGPALASLQHAAPEHVYAGMRAGEDLARHYASGDLFLFPSLTETFGNVTLEALASGLGVVAFDYAAAGELVQHGENGMLAPLGNGGAFVEHAVRLATKPQLLSSVRERARTSIATRHWDAIVSVWLEHLEACVARYRSINDGKTGIFLAAD